MKKTITFFALVLSLHALLAQSYKPENFGLKPYSLTHPDMGVINYYVTLNQIEVKKPLLIFVEK